MGFMGIVMSMILLPLAVLAESNSSSSPRTLLVVPFQVESLGLASFQSLKRGLPSLKILTDLDRTPADSTGDIVHFLRQTDSKIHLVCFDRSAADCLEALLHYPELQKKVVRFVSLEGKVKGARNSIGILRPDVVDVERAQKLPLSQAFVFALSRFKEWIFPRPAGAYAMNPIVRRKYLQAKRSEIEKMTQNIQVISIDSSGENYGVVPFSKKYKVYQNEKIKSL